MARAILFDVMGDNRATFRISRTWNGAILSADEQATLRVAWSNLGHAELSWDAPWLGGPHPSQPPGCCWGLWEYSVLELFLVFDDGSYVEYEFGPAGHWLALYLSGYRVLERLMDGVDYRWRREGERWLGEARVPIPRARSHRVERGNAFLIARDGQHRRHWAASGVPGTVPDFHRHDCYLTW